MTYEEVLAELLARILASKNNSVLARTTDLAEVPYEAAENPHTP